MPTHQLMHKALQLNLLTSYSTIFRHTYQLEEQVLCTIAMAKNSAAGLQFRARTCQEQERGKKGGGKASILSLSQSRPERGKSPLSRCWTCRHSLPLHWINLRTMREWQYHGPHRPGETHMCNSNTHLLLDLATADSWNWVRYTPWSHSTRYESHQPTPKLCSCYRYSEPVSNGTEGP